MSLLLTLTGMLISFVVGGLYKAHQLTKIQRNRVLIARDDLHAAYRWAAGMLLSGEVSDLSEFVQLLDTMGPTFSNVSRYITYYVGNETHNSSDLTEVGKELLFQGLVD